MAARPELAAMVRDAALRDAPHHEGYRNFSILILRSLAKRGVSKDGRATGTYRDGSRRGATRRSSPRRFGGRPRPYSERGGRLQIVDRSTRHRNRMGGNG